MTKAVLNPRQQELLMDWLSDRADAFTIDDVRLKFAVHYMTAYKWVKYLEDCGLIGKHPLRRGRADQYVKTEGNFVIPQGALKVQRGNEAMDLAHWVMTNLSNAHIPAVAHAMAYLFFRSYYANEPDFQHLRGAIPAVDVRTYITDRLAALEKDVEVIRQILGYRLPFGEGNDLAQRFGNPPVGVSLTDVSIAARAFIDAMTPDQEELAQEIASQSPPVPPVEEAPRTIGEALETTLHVVRDDEPIPFADEPL